MTEDPFDKLGGLLEQRFSMLEDRIEIIDKIQAQLMTGLGELWAGLEALTEFILDSKTEEEREGFKQGLARYSNELWKAVSESVTRTVEQPPDGANPTDVAGGSDAPPGGGEGQEPG